MIDQTTTKPCCTGVEDDPPPREALDDVAAAFKALGDANRSTIVHLLAAAPSAVCVCDLEEHLTLSQPTVSHHLKVLSEAGLLDRRQEGRWAYYSVRRDRLAELRRRLEEWERA